MITVYINKMATIQYGEGVGYLQNFAFCIDGVLGWDEWMDWEGCIFGALRDWPRGSGDIIVISVLRTK